MTARPETEFSESRAQFGARAHGKDIVWSGAILPEHVQRQKQLAARGMARQQGNHICDRLHLSGFDGIFLRSLTKDPCRAIKNRARRV
jgi:hypothetical protein